MGMSMQGWLGGGVESDSQADTQKIIETESVCFGTDFTAVVLGPIFFTLFTNDPQDYLESK